LKTKALLHQLTDFSKIMNRAFYSVPALILVFSIFSAGRASAQSSDISPYSRYGLGDLQDQSSALNFSMGGTGIAYHNDGSTPFLINLKNPASYAYGFIPVEDSSGKGGLKMAAFEAGIIDDDESVTTEGQTIHSNNAYLGYLALNIPMSRHFGLALGLTPVSSAGYNISTNSNIDTNTMATSSPKMGTTVTNQYQGSGGINKVFVGLAYAPIKNLSVGANVSYLFGNITNEEDIYFPLNAAAFNTLKIENTGVHSFDADFGIMYTFKGKFMGDWSVTLGATVAPSFLVNSSYSIFSGPVYSNAGVSQTMDTVQDSSSNGKIRLPLTYGGGITIKKGDHLTISFDYSAQNWSQYTYFGQTEDLSNSYKYAMGIQYVPNKDYPKTYGQRIHFRFGASYARNYLDLDNTPLIERDITAGVGLPIGPSNPFNHPAMLNIGVEVGQLGTGSNNLIQQNYFKLMVGFTFDDHWFEKRKFQ
jgi:hypothetical protein